MLIVKHKQWNVSIQCQEIQDLKHKELKRIRKDMQIIYQDPFGSLNPRMRTIDIISEPLDINRTINRSEKEQKVIELMELVEIGRASCRERVKMAVGGV